MQIQVLDHGYVLEVEAWGSDERIVEAARMSTGKGFLGWGQLRCACGAVSTSANIRSSGDAEGAIFEDSQNTRCSVNRGGVHRVLPDSKPGDEKLLRYLWTNKHATPFEMAGMVIEVQAPIFVFREWHRHRTQSYNEMSARYMPLPDVNYIPSVARLLLGGGHLTKQAGTVAGAEDLTTDTAEDFRRRLAFQYEAAQRLYEDALKFGVPKELARVHLPVGRYSRMRASANLRNWLAFLTLRTAPAAQWEIRQFANAVGSLIQLRFPRTWELFLEGQARG